MLQAFSYHCILFVQKFYTFLMSFRFGSFGKNSLLTTPSDFILTKNIFIGNEVFINKHCLLSAYEKIIIKDNVQIGFRSMLLTSNYTLYFDPKRKQREKIFKPIVIEEGVFICSSVVILPGVTVGYGSVVAAGSVVTKDVPPMTLVAGVPAKVIRTIKPDTDSI